MYATIDGDKKLGAGPPCITDIPIIYPHSLKSLPFIAMVESTGYQFVKYVCCITVNNSVERNQEMPRHYRLPPSSYAHDAANMGSTINSYHL